MFLRMFLPPSVELSLYLQLWKCARPISLASSKGRPGSLYKDESMLCHLPVKGLEKTRAVPPTHPGGAAKISLRATARYQNLQSPEKNYPPLPTPCTVRPHFRKKEKVGTNEKRKPNPMKKVAPPRKQVLTTSKHQHVVDKIPCGSPALPSPRFRVLASRHSTARTGFSSTPQRPI